MIDPFNSRLSSICGLSTGAAGLGRSAFSLNCYSLYFSCYGVCCSLRFSSVTWLFVVLMLVALLTSLSSDR